MFYISQCVYFKTYWISNPYYYKRMINICNLVAQENYEFQIFLLHFTVTYCSLFTDVTLYSHMCHVRILLHVCFCDDIMCLDLTCTMWKYFLWPVCCFRKYIYAFNPILSHSPFLKLRTPTTTLHIDVREAQMQTWSNIILFIGNRPGHPGFMQSVQLVNQSQLNLQVCVFLIMQISWLVPSLH